MEGLLVNLPAFLLVLCRITSFFVVAPVFTFRGVPNQFKVGIAFFVALIAYTISSPAANVSFDGYFVLAIIREVLVGLLLGFVAYLFFTVVQIAGSFVDLQMGFGIVNVMDPVTGVQSPILGSFKYIIAILLFLSVNGHHFLISAIMDSYSWIPLEHELFVHIYNGEVSAFLIESFVTVFILAFKMAAPLIVSLFLADVALGMLARTAPQFNLFVVGIPIKILLGFVVFLFMMSGFLALFIQLFQQMLSSLGELITILSQSSE